MTEPKHMEVFRYRLDPDFKGEFDDLYGRMVTIVSAMPGYIEHKVFRHEDGEYCLIAYFKDRETVDAWDVHPEHKYAKERGKADIFRFYDVAVGEIYEHHRMEK